MSIKDKVIHEVKKTALITLYFLVGFNLLAVMLVLIDPDFRSPATLFTSATLAALVLGKVMVILDGLIANRLARHSSFLRVVLTKTLILTACIIAVLFLEEVVHGVLAEDLGWAAAWNHAWEHTSWRRFSSRAVYLVVLFALYSFIFELDQFLGRWSVLGIVLSKYHEPVLRDFWVLHMRLHANAPEERAGARARIAQAIYADIETAVNSRGGHLGYYAGRRNILLVPASDHAAQTCVDIVKAVHGIVLSHGDLIRREIDTMPELSAGIARGVLHEVEVIGRSSRDILTDGRALDEAAELERACESGAMLFADELRTELEGAGLTAQHVEYDGGAAWRISI